MNIAEISGLIFIILLFQLILQVEADSIYSKQGLSVSSFKYKEKFQVIINASFKNNKIRKIFTPFIFIFLMIALISEILVTPILLIICFLISIPLLFLLFITVQFGKLLKIIIYKKEQSIIGSD